MDVLSLGDNHYRCVLDHNGRLRYRPISADEAGWKVCRIEGKSTIKGGKTQLNLHDGRNIIVDDAAEYSTGSSLKLALPSQDIIEHIKFAEGVRCYLIGGAHVGGFANMTSFEVKRFQHGKRSPVRRFRYRCQQRLRCRRRNPSKHRGG